MSTDISQHSLVPKHTKASDTEKEKLCRAYGISLREFPKILVSDPVIAKLGVKVGDLIKIERSSKTAGVSYYYRIVIEG